MTIAIVAVSIDAGALPAGGHAPRHADGDGEYDCNDSLPHAGVLRNEVRVSWRHGIVGASQRHEEEIRLA
jgi:hypothetical protein